MTKYISLFEQQCVLMVPRSANANVTSLDGRNNVLPFTTTCTDPEGITLSETSQRKTDAVRSRLHVES